jgi:hypothetical protein
MSRSVALITGASAGIGREYARALATRGYDIIAVARRAERLRELSDELAALGAQTEALVLDLTKTFDRDTVVQRIRRGDVAFVANVAGFGGYGRFDTLDPNLIDGLIAIHVQAIAEFTHAAVSRAPIPTTVVNVASLLSMSGGLPPQPLPARATYAGAKAYMLTFTETLAAEAIPGLTVQVVLPGMVATEFGGGYSPEIAMDPRDVVTASLVGLERGEIICVPGLEDATVLERLKAARLAVLQGGNQRSLSSRYHASS